MRQRCCLHDGRCLPPPLLQPFENKALPLRARRCSTRRVSPSHPAPAPHQARANASSPHALPPGECARSESGALVRLSKRRLERSRRAVDNGALHAAASRAEGGLGYKMGSEGSEGWPQGECLCAPKGANLSAFIRKNMRIVALITGDVTCKRSTCGTVECVIVRGMAAANACDRTPA